MAFVELYILNAQYVAAGVPIRIYGYPWPTEQVTTESCLARFPTWTLDNPDCYFLNYEHLLMISIAAFFIGFILFRYSKPEIPTPEGDQSNRDWEGKMGPPR
ncbi:MAG TPA: hypothetical protein VGA05_06890 [Candidatus Bathyarchaeia archaeon]